MEQSGPSFSGEEREFMDEYRSVSMFAVASFVLGILSVGSLVHPGVWVVPIIAVGCGVFGLRSIRKQDRMGGTVPAWAGIVLALVCLSWALSQFYFSRWARPERLDVRENRPPERVYCEVWRPPAHVLEARRTSRKALALRNKELRYIS